MKKISLLVINVIFLSLIIFTFSYSAKLPISPVEYVQDSDVLKFPYPYKAMLTICSDIDGTKLESFERYHTLLNTRGRVYDKYDGVGLDVADTFWVYSGRSSKKSMAMFGGKNFKEPTFAEDIKKYWDMGYIDAIHSFGNFSKKGNITRRYAKKAWKAMQEYGVMPEIWINHGDSNNVDNFGNVSMRYQQGDDKTSEAYHTDISIPNGIRFVWNSQGSDQFGMEYPLYPITLLDGQKVWGFNRYTNEEIDGKVIWKWIPFCVNEVLSDENLQSLIDNEQYAIYANHLGSDKIYPHSVEAYERLRKAQDDGDILVARTSRLLKYAVAQKFMRFEKSINDDGTIVFNILSIDDPMLGEYIPTIEDLRGITFKSNRLAKITLCGVEISEEELIRDDGVIGIKWFELIE